MIKNNELNEDKKPAVVPIGDQQNTKESILTKREDVGPEPAIQNQLEQLIRFKEKHNAEPASTKSIAELTQALKELASDQEKIEESESSVGKLTHVGEEALQGQLANDGQRAEQELSSVKELTGESVEEETSGVELEQELVPKSVHEPIYVSAEILKSIESLFDWNDALVYRRFRLAIHKFIKSLSSDFNFQMRGLTPPSLDGISF